MTLSKRFGYVFGQPIARLKHCTAGHRTGHKSVKWSHNGSFLSVFSRRVSDLKFRRTAFLPRSHGQQLRLKQAPLQTGLGRRRQAAGAGARARSATAGRRSGRCPALPKNGRPDTIGTCDDFEQSFMLRLLQNLSLFESNKHR